MSHTIRNERTRGWLDRLAQVRRERKQARNLKEEVLNWEDTDLSEYAA